MTPAPVSRPLLLFALTGGVAAWTVHLVGGSMLVPAACTYGLGWTIDVLTLVTAAVCVAGMAAGVHIQRRSPPADGSASAYRLLGYLAVTSGAISLALVLAEGSMRLWLPPCR